MTNPPVPPLRASDAERISNLVDLLEYDDKLLAIRDGHHKCIAVCTEAEAREAFEEWVKDPFNTAQFLTRSVNLKTWLAALRWAGKIEDKQS